MSKLIWTVLAIVGLVAAGGIMFLVMTQRGQDTGPLPVQSGQLSIDIRGMAYAPSAIKIKRGSTIVWTNQDNIGHNVVADNPGDGSGLPGEHELLQKGHNFSHTFQNAGVFHYHCTPHPFMKGTVEVVD